MQELGAAAMIAIPVLLLVVAWAGARGLLWGDLPLQRGVPPSKGQRVVARVVGGVVVLALLGVVLAIGWVTSSD